MQTSFLLQSSSELQLLWRWRIKGSAFLAQAKLPSASWLKPSWQTHSPSSWPASWEQTRLTPRQSWSFIQRVRPGNRTTVTTYELMVEQLANLSWRGNWKKNTIEILNECRRDDESLLGNRVLIAPISRLMMLQRDVHLSEHPPRWGWRGGRGRGGGRSEITRRMSSFHSTDSQSERRNIKTCYCSNLSIFTFKIWRQEGLLMKRLRRWRLCTVLLYKRDYSVNNIKNI